MPKDPPVNINQTSSAGARMCFYGHYLYMAYEKDGACWISRSPDGWHWQDTRQLAASMDGGTVPALASSSGLLIVAYANNGTFVVMGTEDGLKWEINQVVSGNNFYTREGITIAISDELYIIWVEYSSWKIFMIHTIGGISGEMKWTAPEMLTDPTANLSNSPPMVVNFQNEIYLIYQEFGGIGSAPQPDSPAPSTLYWAKYNGNIWTPGSLLPITGNPGYPSLTIASSGNALVLVYCIRNAIPIRFTQQLPRMVILGGRR